MIAGGRPAVVLGINVVGLRRAGVSAPVREEIKRAYKLLYRSGLNTSQAVEIMKKEFESPEIKHLIHFIENSKRGIIDGTREVPVPKVPGSKQLSTEPGTFGTGTEDLDFSENED